MVKNENCRLLAIESCYSLKIPNYIAGKTGAKVISIPHHVNAMEGCRTYLEFIDTLVKKITLAGNALTEEEKGYDADEKQQNKRKRKHERKWKCKRGEKRDK